jgi:hypothetical protein
LRAVIVELELYHTVLPSKLPELAATGITNCFCSHSKIARKNRLCSILVTIDSESAVTQMSL